MFARTGKCNWSPCKFPHEPPATSASSPSPLARREEGGGSVAAAGRGSRTSSLRPVFPAGDNRGGEGGGGAGSGSGRRHGPSRQVGQTFAGAAAAQAVDVAVASIIESGGRVLGSTSAGAAAALVVGGGVASTVDVDGTPTVPAARGVTGGLRGRASEAQAGEGGVGREWVPAAPGSVIFGNIGDHGERARSCTIVLSRIVERAYRSRAEIQLAIAVVCDVRILTGGADTARPTASARTYSWIRWLRRGAMRRIA